MAVLPRARIAQHRGGTKYVVGATIRSIELYTDGYFKPGATPALDDWEAAFAEVERIDPEKIGRYPSVKGSSARMRADDRSDVIVHF